MRPERGAAGRAGEAAGPTPEAGIRVTWLEARVAPDATPARSRALAGPGWAPYLLACLAGALLLLATVAWPL